MSFLQCPECRLTVPAAAYYLRGDECPRCLTSMLPVKRFQSRGGRSPAAPRRIPGSREPSQRMPR